jgi:protein tyrosine kinase modulator
MLHGPPDNEQFVDRAAAHDANADKFGDMQRSVAEILRILTVRKWMFLIPMCLATTTALVLSLYVPRRYIASTVFERRDDPVLMNLPTTEGAGAFESFRRTLVQDVTSADAIAEMVAETGIGSPGGGSATSNITPDPIPASNRSIAGRIASGLEVAFHQQSPHLDVIEIRYTSNDSSTAANILNNVRDHYIKSTQQRINSLLRETKEYFDQQCKQRQILVESLEEEQLRYRADHHGIDPLSPMLSFGRLDTFRTDLVALQRRENDLRTQIKGRKKVVASQDASYPLGLMSNVGGAIGPVRAVRSSESSRLAVEIRDIQTQIDELKESRGMTDRHPDIVSLKRKSRRLTEALTTQEADDARVYAANTTMQLPHDGATVPRVPVGPTQAEVELEIAERLLADNSDEIARIRGEIKKLEEIQNHAVDNRKDFSAKQAEIVRATQDLQLYQEYADRVGRVLAADSSERGILFGKIKPAACSNIPVSPRLSTVILLALVAGVALGVVMVLLSELFDRTIRTRDQIVRGLGLPILESIDEIISSAVRRRRLLSRLVIVPSITTALAAIVIMSGAMAYLSLHNKPLYERAISMPRAILDRAVQVWSPPKEIMAMGDADEEIPG